MNKMNIKTIGIDMKGNVIELQTHICSPFNGDDIAVLKNGEPVRYYNSLSDDYAYSNARQFAVELVNKLKGAH